MIRTVTLALALGLVSVGNSASPVAKPAWNPKAAAAYLDRRAGWWIAWPDAARDQGTFCISCHTALPYSLARPALRTALGEKEASNNERVLLEDVTKRVQLWNRIGPFYRDDYGAGRSQQSRGTESVLNALILASYDARNGSLTGTTRTAFQNMWALQEKAGPEKGSWPWLDFGNQPFEAKDSRFYGATLAAMAVGTAPEGFGPAPAVRTSVKLLRDYLEREYPNQSLINQTDVLWASARLPGILTPNQQASILNAILAKQQADGGWSLSSLSWTWRGSTMKSMVKLWTRSEYPLLGNRSDGYATAVVALALEETGFPRENVHLTDALRWLRTNQNPVDGRWAGYSLNHHRDASSGTSLFMSDAATAYAVLALSE
jgi:squalene-hopene/tetraprenyl-beta-curcumene cyclase